MKAKSQNRIFLGKRGKSWGPYTPAEVDAMKSRGELADYHWIWDLDARQWLALDPPPPPLTDADLAETEPTAAISPTPPSEVTEAPKAPGRHRPKRHDAFLPIEAICHNSQTALSGGVKNASERGFDLVVHSHQAAPPFARHSRIFLNLLNPETGESTDVSAQLVDITRNNNLWTYHIEWSACPELVLQFI